MMLSDDKTYEQLSKDPNPKYKSWLWDILKRQKNGDKITVGQYDHLHPTAENIPRMYCTSKIINRTPHLRPIVDYTGSICYNITAGLGGSVGCVVRLETRRSRVQPPPRSATFFRRDWSWNIFYVHSLPSADSRRAVVSFWRKNVHNTG